MCLDLKNKGQRPGLESLPNEYTHRSIFASAGVRVNSVPVNNVPYIVNKLCPPVVAWSAPLCMCFQGGLALFAKFIALQLAVGIMHGPDNSSTTHEMQLTRIPHTQVFLTRTV